VKVKSLHVRNYTAKKRHEADLSIKNSERIEKFTDIRDKLQEEERLVANDFEKVVNLRTQNPTPDLTK